MKLSAGSRLVGNNSNKIFIIAPWVLRICKEEKILAAHRIYYLNKLHMSLSTQSLREVPKKNRMRQPLIRNEIKKSFDFVNHQVQSLFHWSQCIICTPISGANSHSTVFIICSMNCKVNTVEITQILDCLVMSRDGQVEPIRCFDGS